MKGCFLSYICFKCGKRAAVWAALTCLVLAAASCRTIQTVEVPVPIHDTAYVAKEIHDSVWVENTVTEYVKGDTVFKDKVQVKYVERVRVDTMMTYREKPVEVKIETTKYIEKQLAWWQKTLMYTGVFFLVGVVFFLILLIVKSKT